MMEKDSGKLQFTCDYQEGAHEAIIQKLVETNLEQTPGYGFDAYCESAKAKIREACQCPEAQIYFLIGGTQTNATVIDALLQSYQGVIAADTGHISVHEAGAIELGGHKVLTLPHTYGKIDAGQIQKLLRDYYEDANYEHMVMPGMVYLSQPTEYGTLYSKKELEAIHQICREYQIPLYVDGARLAYALASEANDVELSDLAGLCDAFYIGGTKCGALLGEAVVVPDPKRIPHFFTIIKQHGALLAKGRLLGIQFDTLFTDDLYLKIGKNADRYAGEIQEILKSNGYELMLETSTNQVFCIMEDEKLKCLEEKVTYGFWEKQDAAHTIIRFATSWATREDEVKELVEILTALSRD